MLRTAVYGYGNIGRFSLEALLASPDFEVAGVVSASLSAGSLGDIPVVRSIDELSQVDVAILCSPSRAVPDLAAQLLEKGICTVDSFDIHTEVWDVRQRLDAVAKAHGTACIMSAGWDPGTDSMVRALLEAMAPGRAYLYQLWTWYEHGPYRGSKGGPRRKKRPFHDDSCRHRNSPPYGICGAGGWRGLRGRFFCH